ncbi:MAG: prolyl oligopeptidase family serine peptidase, partial [Gemmatimonadales bacterium]
MTKLAYPPTRTDETIEVLHGETVADPYRWLERGDDPDTRAWTERQNALTEEYLDGVPGRERIRRRLDELLAIGAISVPTPAHGRYFYQRREGRQNQPVLYVRDGVAGEDRAAVDPNALDPAGTTALDWFFPSDDGHLLAYGLSENGSEQSVLHVLDVARNVHLPDRIPRTRSADLAWLPDACGFYYTRYPAPGDVAEGEEHYHRAVYYHALGTDPAADPLIYQPARKEYWPGVSLSPDGRWLLIGVARTFDQTDLYLGDRAAAGSHAPPLVAVAEQLAASFDGEIVRDRLWLRTNLDAPTYRLYEVDPERPERGGWREVVPPRQDAVLEGARVVGDHLVLSYLERASSRLRLAGLDGRIRREVALPMLGSVFGAGSEWDGRELFFGFSSYTVPPTIYRLDLDRDEQTLWRRVEADVDPERFEVRQVSVESRDGTPVTMFLVHPRDLVPNGDVATYLTGYGGFNISMTPAFSRSLLLWLEHGGIVAIPNIRGGGEYGESWHQDGMLGRKQNSFDDFVAAAEWLVREGYTRPDRLAVAG